MRGGVRTLEKVMDAGLSRFQYGGETITGWIIIPFSVTKHIGMMQ